MHNTLREKPARILIIEDDETEIWLLRQAFDQAGEEYVMDVLRDGEEALRFIQAQRKSDAEPEPCVVVLDLHLPKYDGAAVLQAIREEPVLAHVRVIVVTTLASPKEEAEVRNLGVRLYRAKPRALRDYDVLAKEILEICHEATPV
jgi:CheY-like chemotaxis protein